ncbi:MAG TPA: sigma-70 family RNA polymerase sigma factor [Planctomycetota bacterium]
MTPAPGLARICAARAGDPEAVAALWRLHRPWVAAVLLARMPQGAELDDLLQEVATTLVARISDLREPERFEPWLRAVALNAALTAGRRERTRGRARSLATGDAETADPSATTASDLAETRERTDRVLQAARGLPAEYREPLLLRAVNGASQSSIARQLGVTEAAVEARLARARRLLREQLARIEAAPPAVRRASSGPQDQ